jgi:hypothetical protein
MQRGKKMNTKKSIGMLLIAAFIITIVTAVPLHQASAQTTGTKTYPLIETMPATIGVGQEVLVRTGILQQLGSVDFGWTGITVTVIKPDNTTQTYGPFTTDSTGSTFFTIVPDQIGTYKLRTNFPEQPCPTTFFSYESNSLFLQGQTMLASTSYYVNLTVTQAPAPDYPNHALPTEYWSRPIDPQLMSWATIAGNWVMRPDNSIALYNDDAPETAHVLWAHPYTTGGLIGGLYGDGQVPVGAESGDAYEGKFSGSVILNGVLYYQRTDPGETTDIMQVDLHTGVESLFKANTDLSFGQVFYFNSYNVDGTYTYIWTTSSVTNPDFSSNTTWTAWDPFNGNQIMQIKNVPSGVQAFGPSGEILIYQIDYVHKWLALWNSTDCGLQNAVMGTPDYGSWGNTAQGSALGPGLDGANPRCYSWNVSIPAGLVAGTSFFSPILKILPDRVVSLYFNQTYVRVWGLSTAVGSRGTSLFDQVWTPPAEWLAGSNTIHYVGATDYVKGGVIGLWDKELTTHYGFSVETGRYLWSTSPEYWSDAYGWGNAEHTWYYAYGNLYSVGIGGILYAYDLQTGKTLWTYTMSDAYHQPVTGDNWWGWIDLIADGKIYIGTLEHSAEQPIPRGAPYICVNATDGSEIWRVNGMYRETRWGGNGIMGDSIITTMDTYDQQVWAIGKGPTALTITASPKVSTEGSSVLIEGMVTDTSPGTSDLTARFPNGVPAVSDASQSQWMLYVYKQFELPSNATGVTVSLNVIDANGNYRNIGTTTSDSMGVYSFSWTPDISGKYSVFATFAGSKAYYASSAESAFVVDTIHDHPTVAPTATPASMADQYFLPLSIGMILAIVIIGAILALLLLRKRP